MSKIRFSGRAALSLLGAVVSVATLFSALPVFSSAEQEEHTIGIYVSPEGSDSGDGSREAPFRTLGRANEAVGTLTSDSDAEYTDITVYLDGGMYLSEDTVTLDNGGGDNTRVTYRAQDGEEPVICGGEVLSPERFYKPDPEAVACIKDETARSAVVAYDLTADGINPAGRRLYSGGKSCTVARYPNIWDSDNPPLPIKNSAEISQSPVRFSMDADEVVSTWSTTEGVCLGGHFVIDWIQTDGILDGYDRDAGRISVTVTSGNKEYRDGGRYFFTNVFDEIDVPGEYYIGSDGILYFYPEGDISDEQLMFSGNIETLIRVSGDRITLDGLTVRGVTGDAVEVDASHCAVMNSIIDCADRDGIVINGFDNRIYNNEISEIGYTAVRMSGGDRTLGIPSDSSVDNNYIHDFAQVRTVYEGACKFDGTGFSMSHNEICNSPHYAISGDVRDLIIDHNYIHNVCREGGDCGAVYIAWWSNQNIVFEYNYVKDIYNEYVLAAPNGFYTDDGGSGKVCRCNLFYNVAGISVMIGGGKDMTVTDNVILKGPQSYNSSIQYDGRTYYDDWCAYFVTLVNGIPPTRDILWDDIFSEAGYATEAWAYRYPRTLFYKTTTVQDREDRFVPYATACAVVRNNVIMPTVNSIVRPLSVEKFAVMRDNIFFDTIEEMGFTDPENGDFTLCEDSPIFRRLPGFRAYDFSDFGRETGCTD